MKPVRARSGCTGRNAWTGRPPSPLPEAAWSRLAAVVFLLPFISATAAPAQTFFDATFEQGSLCGWSDAAGLCVDADDLAQRAVGAYPLCVAPYEVSYSYQPIPWLPPVGVVSGVLCGQSQCANGSPGCDATVHVTSASLDVVTGQGSFTATLDDADFPMQLTLNNATESDTLSVTRGGGTGTFTFTMTTTCFTDIWQTNAPASAQVDLSATLACSGGPLANVANLALSIWQPLIEQQIDTKAVPAILGVLPTLTEAWVCPGS